MEEKELDTVIGSGDTEQADEAAETDGAHVPEVLTAELSEEDNAAAEDGESASVLSVEFYGWFDTLLHALLAVVAIFAVVTRMSTVDGSSMVPTLEDQQRLMISDFMYKPAYNDVVIVWANGIPNDLGTLGKAICKRVIGLPGDTINIDYENGRVYRNGEVLPIEMKDGVLYEDGHMINSYTNREEYLGGDFIVPEGHLFVMGDNRNNSTDSRSAMVGYVDIREVIGRAYLRLWPFDKFGGIYG